MDTFLNYKFVCLKDHKWSIIVWIIITFFRIFFINYKVYMLKASHNFFLKITCSKHSNIESGQLLFFSHVLFLYQMCTIPSKNCKKISTLMIKKEKWFELMNYFLYNWFEHIWFESVFEPKNYGFWKCALNKSCS